MSSEPSSMSATMPEPSPAAPTSAATESSSTDVQRSSSVQQGVPRKGKFLWSDDLADFLSALDVYNPTVPDAVSMYYAERCGLAVKDPRIPKLLSLAADKFLTEIIFEAKQVSLSKQKPSGTGNRTSNKRKSGTNDILEQDDLEGSLAQMRVYLKRCKQSSSSSSSSSSGNDAANAPSSLGTADP